MYKYTIAALVLSFMAASLSAAAEEKELTIGDLLSQGYEIKATLVLQKGEKAYAQSVIY